MRLGEILEGADVLECRGSRDVEVTGLCHDSRKFKSGQLFIAIPGLKYDGHTFVPQACANGAAAVVVQNKECVPANFKGSAVVVKDTRKTLDKLAANFFGNPSQELFCVGVTGTNGKTTTTHMIEAVLNAHKMPTGVMGTIDCHLGNERTEASHTTPDALDLQATLANWLKKGAKAAAMEVSSHALSLGRVDSVAFDAAVFTNLTRDHLDFHGTMEEYKNSKKKLFGELLKNSPKKNKRAIINIDDPVGKEMAAASAAEVWTYGFAAGSAAAAPADIAAVDLKLSLDETAFEAKTPRGTFPVRLKMIGRHNVYNALAAIGVGLHSGAEIKTITDALSGLRGVKGRLERVTSKSQVRAFVDYAHSDDALVNVLGFLKQLRDETGPSARITTVFGCGGDRDKGKRPLMLDAALRFSDSVVVTSDNPRTEEPGQIIKDILSGQAHPPARVTVEVDRRKAIEIALKKAKPFDVVLIAGKGHEDYQIIGTTKFPFDDVKIAKEILDS